MLHDIFLHTDRLLLRSPNLSDTPRIVELLGDYDVVKSTLNIPYPYTEQDAIDWLNRIKTSIDQGAIIYNFALIRKEDDLFIGSISMSIQAHHRRAEIGYWLGKAYWGNGYTTEAAKRTIQFGYEACDLIRIAAGYFTTNPASGRVMQKCGMTYEGTYRKYMQRDGVLHDVAYYSILRDEWVKQGSV